MSRKPATEVWLAPSPQGWIQATVTYAAIQAGALLGQLLVFRYAVNVLGPYNYGLAGITVAALSFLTILELGISPVSIRVSSGRAAAGDWAGLRDAATAGLVIRTAIGVTGALVSLVLGPTLLKQFLHDVTANDITLISQLIAIAFPLQIIADGFENIHRAVQQFRRINAILATSRVLRLGVATALLATTRSWTALIVAAIAEAAITIGFYLLSLARMGGIRLFIGGATKKTLGLLAIGSTWLALADALGSVLGYSDRFAVARLVSLRSLTFYIAASTAAGALGLLVASLNNSLLPRFSWAEAEGRLAALGARSLRCLLCAGWPLLLAMSVWSEAAMRLWLGREFADASATSLRLMMIAAAGRLLGQVGWSMVQAKEWFSRSAIIYGVETMVFIPILWFATRRYGLTGAASAVMGRSLIDAVVFWIVGSRSDDRAVVLTRRGWFVVAASLFSALIPATGAASSCLQFIAIVIFGIYLVRRELSVEDRRVLSAVLPVQRFR